jgi:RNA polymerase sigma-32 factor
MYQYFGQAVGGGIGLRHAPLVAKRNHFDKTFTKKIISIRNQKDAPMNKPVRNWQKRRTRRGRHEMLPPEEELRLARAWQQAGDKTARDRLVEAFMPLAGAMAKRFGAGTGAADPDLAQQAHIGLLKAADRFDPDQGVRFSTYAVWWVRAEIQDFKLANLSVVRRPNTASFRNAFFNLSRVEQSIGTDAQEPETTRDARIAAELGVAPKKLTDLRMQLSGGDSSLNAPAQEEDGADRMALLPDHETDVEAEVRGHLDRAKLRETIVAAMQALPDREREIILATQLADPPATLEALAPRFGISKERVRQLRERGFERLRDTLRRLDVTPEAML